MLDPGWAARTPDANDLLLKGGTGPTTMLTALAAYTAEMAATEAAAGSSTANMAALNTQFQGATNVASTSTVTGLNTVAHLIFSVPEAAPRGRAPSPPRCARFHALLLRDGSGSCATVGAAHWDGRMGRRAGSARRKSTLRV